MTYPRDLLCNDDERRNTVAADAALSGIDYIEVVTEPAALNQRLLKVYFIAKTTAAGSASLAVLLSALNDSVGKVTIEGGVRVPRVEVLSVKHVSGHLEISVREPGDYSIYTLAIDDSSLDPVYARCEVNFKVGCPSRFDCRPRRAGAVSSRREPSIDYLAKDYASFRRALVDLIPSLMPGWKERHEADLGIALVELLAYAGDQLSYYQDAVANEAFLETARQRISVRRHARLVDYHIDEGASARAFVHFKGTSSGTVPAGTAVISGIDTPLGSQMPPHPTVISGAAADLALAAGKVVFETLQDARVHSELDEIPIHTWGNRLCGLARGATSLDLQGDLASALAPGDFLLLEEVLGPRTGKPADADPSHRRIVRLTTVRGTKDPLLPDAASGTPPMKLTHVEWDRADALDCAFCLSGETDEGERFEDATVARGNLVLADHGRTVSEWYPSDPASPSATGITLGERAFRCRLKEKPLSFRVLMPKEDLAPASVKGIVAGDEQAIEPQVSLSVRTAMGAVLPATGVPDLLESTSFDLDYVVETDNDGRALLRFGDGTFGEAPAAGSFLEASYRIGCGLAGNVGRDSLAHVVKPAAATAWPSISDVRNPLPAWGGREPEALERVKRLAPAAVHAVQKRAVTEADYARVAEEHPAVSKAVATFRWTGSWHTVFVTVDPVGRTDLPPTTHQNILAWVRRFTQAGYDLEVDAPIYVPLEIAIDVCVAREHFRADVQRALLDALSNLVLPDGTLGFFHPDQFTFGEPVYLSRLYAAVKAVEGVDSAVVTTFKRFAESANREIEQGAIAIGRLEVARLDNDPSAPENGVLRLDLRGGR